VAFQIVIDSREKTPFLFHGLKADAAQGRRPLMVATTVKGLPSGDYSIEGHEGAVAVERKSLADLYSTISQGRDRFERELERLDAMACAAVVIEASWHQIINDPPPYSKLPAKNVFRSILSWQQRWPRVNWWPAEGRRFAEVITFRWLERFWKDSQAGRRGKPPQE
jgi:hypothetical protein